MSMWPLSVRFCSALLQMRGEAPHPCDDCSTAGRERTLYRDDAHPNGLPDMALCERCAWRRASHRLDTWPTVKSGDETWRPRKVCDWPGSATCTLCAGSFGGDAIALYGYDETEAWVCRACINEHASDFEQDAAAAAKPQPVTCPRCGKETAATLIHVDCSCAPREPAHDGYVCVDSKPPEGTVWVKGAIHSVPMIGKACAPVRFRIKAKCAGQNVRAQMPGHYVPSAVAEVVGPWR